MSDTNHTPEPWIGVSRHNGTVNIETISGSILGMSMKTDRLTYAEVQANARLWVAAPDLLAACKRLVAVALRASIGAEPVEIANAAIAKAEGREVKP